MKSLWQDDARAALLSRIEKVDPAAPRLWGTMSAERMLVHIAESMKMALGEVVCKPKKLPLRFFPLKQIAIFVAPFPKGLPTAPELVPKDPPPPADDTKRELRRLFNAFVARGAGGAWPDHPAFGKLSGKTWGVLSYRHFDHHLRQFGA